MNYHLGVMDVEKKGIQVIFHIPIPGTGTNLAGIQWRDAIVRWLGGSTAIKSALIDITTDENTALKSGAIVEVQEYFVFTSTALTDGQRGAQIIARYNALLTNIIAEKGITLQWIGFAANV